MDRREFLKNLSLVAGALSSGSFANAAGVSLKNNIISAKTGSKRPNIVFIMADDMGYGDVNYFNSQSKIPTPNMDRLAQEGVIFTDAHSGSAVCTPTRYGVMTGRYCWRTGLASRVIRPYNNMMIETSRMTVASLLKKHGYHTACVGKWHLGLTSPSPSPQPHVVLTINDYINNNLTPGPNELGFDYWFGIPGSLDMHPYVYIENGVCTSPPTGYAPASSHPVYYAAGPISEDFVHEEVMPKITEKAVGFIESHQKEHPQDPFFLYFPLTAPHLPYLPLDINHQRSTAGVYGDFVTLVDWSVGQVIKAIEKHGLSGNTLIIVTSDNGAREDLIGEYNNGVSDGSLPQFGHQANHIYRGQKRDIWDGGHREPFIAWWPGKIQSLSTCDKTICLTDLLATCADIVEETLPANAGEDSFSFLPYLLGKTHDGPEREAIVHHDARGGFAIRGGKWKYVDIASDDNPGQLYDMETDPQETNDVYNSQTSKAQELKNLLETYKSQGHSRPL